MSKDNQIDIMVMARKAVEYEHIMSFLRQYLIDTRQLDIIALDHLRESGEHDHWVCDMANGKKGEMVFSAFTIVECLEWALGMPVIATNASEEDMSGGWEQSAYLQDREKLKNQSIYKGRA